MHSKACRRRSLNYQTSEATRFRLMSQFEAEERGGGGRGNVPGHNCALPKTLAAIKSGLRGALANYSRRAEPWPQLPTLSAWHEDLT